MNDLIDIVQTKKREALLTNKQQRSIKYMLILFLFLGYVAVSLAQSTGTELNYVATSSFVPTTKDAVKYADLPEIKDSVKRIENIKYGIVSIPLFPKYAVLLIESAKLQNEPLPKLYHSLLKVGYGLIYNMPYGEFWIANTRSRENNYGAHLKHFSSSTHLKDVGYGGFSDNEVNVFAKQFYKKHTLSGDINYERNVIHYYGYDTTINKLENDFTKQRYQFINPKMQLQSHYTDSTHINHNIQLGFYNLQNLNREAENNIKLNAQGSFFINKEKLNLNFLTDYYNHKQSNDTLNNIILAFNPSFEAKGDKWNADLGLTASMDNFKTQTRFYFFPTINASYNVFENIIIPYIGVTGGKVTKNSFRSLTQLNPFADTTLRYTNTITKYNVYLGLKGNLSSNTSYDTKVSYAQHDSMYFFVMNYGGSNQIFNRYSVIYDNTTLLTISGQLKYQYKEKLNLIAKGNYYLWKPKTLTRAYHKPDFDITFSGIYNLQSKIIVRADLFFIGNQWALTQAQDNGATVLKPKQLQGYADINLEAEYRYSKMLSFFVRLNNIANQRYYRWERNPSQRFNFMVGLTFVPF